MVRATRLQTWELRIGLIGILKSDTAHSKPELQFVLQSRYLIFFYVSLKYGYFQITMHAFPAKTIRKYVNILSLAELNTRHYNFPACYCCYNTASLHFGSKGY